MNATQSMTGRGPNWRSKIKMYHIYYCLAGFDILMLAISLYINHSNVTSFEASIKINETFVQNSRAAEILSGLAAQTNAPGNDIFDSHDVTRERARLSEAVEKFNDFFQKLKKENNILGSNELKSCLDEIENSMQEMLEVAGTIFKFFEANDHKGAGSKMATMDQKYAVLNLKLAQLRTTFNNQQAQELKSQSEAVHKASLMESFLAFIIVFMVIVVTWFGHVMSKKSEAQEMTLREQAKMVALGEMAGGVAHEINNPLAIVRTKASQLRRLITAGKVTPDQGTRFLLDIEETSIRMSKIVDGLRTFSRSSGNEPKTMIQINKIISDVQGLCQERLKNHGVDFNVIFSENFEINCRPVQIEQVLVNLINNSFDAIVNSPSPWIRLEVKRQNDRAEISVTDSGKGIPPEIANKLMQPFFTTKPVGKGTGLGLSISVGIAESHGGSLSLNPKSPNTQFLISLPCLPLPLERAA